MSHVIGHQTYSHTERISFCQSCFVWGSVLGGVLVFGEVYF